MPPPRATIDVVALERSIDAGHPGAGFLQARRVEGLAGEERAAALQAEMAASGVVRLDGVMPDAMAANLHGLVMAELEKEVSSSGRGDDNGERFSQVLSSDNRWDFRLALSEPVRVALAAVLARGSPLGDLLTALVSDGGVLFELGAMVTQRGAERQDVHSDTLQYDAPALYTCFLALQDISADMGPTVFLPGSHAAAALYHSSAPPPADPSDPSAGGSEHGAAGGEGCAARPGGLAAEERHVRATLGRGDAALYDSRTLHCGGANLSDRRRALLYVSFLDPAGQLAVGGVPDMLPRSLLPALRDKYTLRDLRAPPPPSPPGAGDSGAAAAPGGAREAAPAPAAACGVSAAGACVPAASEAAAVAAAAVTAAVAALSLVAA